MFEAAKCRPLTVSAGKVLPKVGSSGRFAGDMGTNTGNTCKCPSPLKSHPIFYRKKKMQAILLKAMKCGKIREVGREAS